MEIVKIQGRSGVSTIVIGDRLKRLGDYVPLKRTVTITDTTVYRLFRKDFPLGRAIQIPAGERSKNLDEVRKLYERLLDLQIDRSFFLLGIGGGIVCDIAGFVASTYLRGLRFGFAPSTLLAQVDASVGGKNGVNLRGFKNLVGVIRQPDFVLCDPSLLETLPDREIACGFAEVIKHALIADPALFSFLEENVDGGLRLDADVLERVVHDSIVIKSGVVSRDEGERGERRILNFGHTFGHGIEKTLGLSHGEAVSIGMVVASGISVLKGYLSEKDLTRITQLLQRYHLPTRLPTGFPRFFRAIGRDKKRQGESLHFVFLRNIGEAVVEKIPLKELEALTEPLLDRGISQIPRARDFGKGRDGSSRNPKGD